ncbi:MAG: hypothetical protein IPO26_21260 [Saprospiraceae bacterium]|nr:hypothetical protein [Saprospiraceae bacterium]
MVGHTPVLNLVGGIDLVGVNAGYTGYSSIGNFVWLDADKDGLQIASEIGINGIAVYLLGDTGAIIDSTNTSYCQEQIGVDIIYLIICLTANTKCDLH